MTDGWTAEDKRGQGMNEFRIWGPPGTGKTTTLKRRIEKAIQEEGIEAESIVCTSFSRAAARELSGRIELPDENIGTLHSFAFRQLGLKKDEVAESKLSEWNQGNPMYALTGRGLDELGPVGSVGKTDGDKYMGEYQFLRARGVPVADWPIHIQLFARQWEAFKKEKNVLDFQDMIEQASPSGMKGGHWLICDEAQDLSPSELALLRQWGQNFGALILAGDPNQAIYYFKGADGEGFVNPPLEARRNHILGQSWRIPAAVHGLAKKWQVVKVDYSPAAHQGVAERMFTTVTEPTMAVDHALMQWARDTNHPETIMFLASAGYMLNEIIRQLRAQAIPYWNPYQVDNGAWNPIRRSTLDLLAAFMRGRLTWEGFWSLTKDLSAVGANAFWHRSRKTLFDRERKGKGKDPITPAEAKEYVLDGVVDTLWSQDTKRLQVLLSFAGDKMRGFGYTLEAAAKWGLEEVQLPRVIVGSIHSVKGAEADHVYLWPELSPAAMRGWETSEADKRATQRAFYVGMTRARRGLYLGKSSHGVDWDYSAPRPYADVEEEVIL